jgi:uncharacterized membrane protein YjfL (UPF0719 family)
MRFDFLIGFMVEASLILVAAKLARDAFFRIRGDNINQLVVQKKSIGAATTQAGYLIGVLLGFLGAIVVRGEDPSFWAIAGSVAVAGVVAIVLQLVADFISDALIFRRVRFRRRPMKQGAPPAAPAGVPGGTSAVEDVNVALAVGKAAVSIATGLVLRGALSDPEAGFLARIAWFAAAQAVMVLAILLYCRLTPYDDLAEIRRDNLAAGFPIAGILLAVGFVIEAAVASRPEATAAHAALAAAKFAGVSLVLVYVFRLLTVLVLLPKVNLAKAIEDEKHVAAGLQEGVSFVLASLIVTFFLT